MAESASEKQQKYDVFLCHSSEDNAKALQINKALKEAKLNTWAHYKEGNEFDVGKSVFDNIRRAVELSNIVLILVTKNALESSWVTFEMLLSFEKSDREQFMCARLVFEGVTEEEKKKFLAGSLELIPSVTIDFNKDNWEKELVAKVKEEERSPSGSSSKSGEGDSQKAEATDASQAAGSAKESTEDASVSKTTEEKTDGSKQSNGRNSRDTCEFIQRVLDKCRVAIVEEKSLDRSATETMLDVFREQKIFEDNTHVEVRDLEDALKIKTSTCLREMCDVLRRHPDSYVTFKSALARTGQETLLETIENKETAYHDGLKGQNLHGCECTGDMRCSLQEPLKCPKGLLPFESSTVKGIQQHLIALYKRECQTVAIYPLQPEERTHVASLFVLPSMRLTNPKGISKHHLMRGEEESGKAVTSIEDIFPPVSSTETNIYIMGDAGTGKSTLCEYLVHLWVSCHSPSNQAADSEEKFMKRFKFLFYISLRVATSCIIEDMIKIQLQLEDVKDEDVTRLLYDHSSLIILDGLDEYFLKQTSKTRFDSENLPSRRHLSRCHSDKCTVLTTSRPWKLELLRRELGNKIDRQISIVGLDTKSQKKLLGNVVDLLNSAENRDKCEENSGKKPEDFISEVLEQKLDKFMKTPILLMQMIGLWFSDEPLGGSKCSLYAKLIDKQMQFTEEVRGFPTNLQKAVPNMPEVKHDDEKVNQDLFFMYFKNYTFIMRYRDLLQKVAKFALCSLSSKNKENSLVFSHEQMELFDMSHEEISLCLELGLLTQYKVFGEITQRLKSISFIHKTHQEFFASIHLSQIDQADELKQLLNREFTSLQQVLEMGTVFMFVCGMNPTVARDISRFIMDKASGDARLEQYRRYSEDLQALVEQLQGLILAGIEEGIQNNHKITGMQLQDLYMNVTDDDFSPARVLACTESLDLSHVKSLIIRDEGTISGDVLQELLKETSTSLHKLVLEDTVVSVEMIQAVVQQQQGRLQTLDLANENVDNFDFSHLNQTDLQAILSAPTHSLLLNGIVLTHSQLEFLCHHVSNSCYREVGLVRLQCTTHGYEETECKQHLDLSANSNLSSLTLSQLPVQEVMFVPDNLVSCVVDTLPNPVITTSIIRCLKRAEKLGLLWCGGLRGSTVAELATTLPHLQHLQDLVLTDINLSGQQQVVQAVTQLKKLEYILMWSVTMREEELRELLELPSSHRVRMALGASSKRPVTITGYNIHTDLLGQIRHNPHIHVWSDEVEIEGDTCTFKKFYFYTDD